MTTVAELKATAKARGLTGYSDLKKDELIKLLTSPKQKSPKTTKILIDDNEDKEYIKKMKSKKFTHMTIAFGVPQKYKKTPQTLSYMINCIAEDLQKNYRGYYDDGWEAPKGYWPDAADPSEKRGWVMKPRWSNPYSMEFAHDEITANFEIQDSKGTVYDVVVSFTLPKYPKFE